MTSCMAWAQAEADLVAFSTFGRKGTHMFTEQARWSNRVLILPGVQRNTEGESEEAKAEALTARLCCEQSDDLVGVDDYNRSAVNQVLARRVRCGRQLSATAS